MSTVRHPFITPVLLVDTEGNPGMDIELGAVELKDEDTDNRATILPNAAAEFDPKGVLVEGWALDSTVRVFRSATLDDTFNPTAAIGFFGLITAAGIRVINATGMSVPLLGRDAGPTITAGLNSLMATSQLYAFDGVDFARLDERAAGATIAPSLNSLLAAGQLYAFDGTNFARVQLRAADEAITGGLGSVLTASQLYAYDNDAGAQSRLTVTTIPVPDPGDDVHALDVNIASGTSIANIVTSYTTDGAVSVLGDTVALAANPARKHVIIVNDSDMTIYLSLGGTATVNSGVRLNANGGAYEINDSNLYFGSINAIQASGIVAKNLTVSEGE